MLKAKDLERVAKIYNHIKSLDEEILQVEKLLISIAEEKADCKITFSSDSYDEKAKPENELSEETIERLNSRMERVFSGLFGPYSPEESTEKGVCTTTEIVHKCTQGFAIDILGFYLNYRQAEREHLIRKLETLNVQL